MRRQDHQLPGARLACSLCKVLEEHQSCPKASWKFSLTPPESGLETSPHTVLRLGAFSLSPLAGRAGQRGLNDAQLISTSPTRTRPRGKGLRSEHEGARANASPASAKRELDVALKEVSQNYPKAIFQVKMKEGKENLNPVSRGNTLNPHLIYARHLLAPAKHLPVPRIHPCTAKA